MKIAVIHDYADALRKTRAFPKLQGHEVVIYNDPYLDPARVVEQVKGETLAQRLADIGSKAPVDAVRSALRVADGLSWLHEAGGAHGLVHPKNVILTPEGRDGPVLVLAPKYAGRAYTSWSGLPNHHRLVSPSMLAKVTRFGHAWPATTTRKSSGPGW